MSRSFCLLLVLLCGVAEAKSPRVVRGPVRTGGTLSRYQIRSTIQRHLSRVKLCYSRALLGAQPSLHGRVVVQFVIEPSGRVSTATARDYMRPKGAGTSMVSCITREVRKWRFPKPLGGGKVVVNYPFIFQTAGATATARRDPKKLPQVFVESITTRGVALTRMAVQRTLRRYHWELRACYAQGLRVQPKLTGSLQLWFALTKGGLPKDVHVTLLLAGGLQTSWAQRKVLDCTTAAVKRWRFARGPMGEVRLDLSLGKRRPKRQGFLKRWRKPAAKTKAPTP